MSFGTAIDMDGDTLVVGAWRDHSSATGINGDAFDTSAPNAGSATVFVRSGTNWVQQAYLKASNAQVHDAFGISVAIDGDTVVIGALNEDSQATGANGDQANNLKPGSGAAYVFTRSGTIWTQQAYLKASDTDVDDGFGIDVALAGDTALVGARGNGAAYVFVRSGTVWTQQAQWTAEASSLFGDSVALSGDTAIVAAPFQNPRVDVFVRNGTSWTQQASLVGSFVETTFPFDLFGWTLALDGDTAVVGASFDDSESNVIDGDGADNSASNAGAAYVFTRSGTSWAQEAYLKAPNSGQGHNFGRACSVRGDYIAVTAPEEDGAALGVNGPFFPSSESSGAAYLFVRSGTTWTYSDYMKGSESPNVQRFGASIRLDNTRIVVGVEEFAGAPGAFETFAMDVPIIVAPYCTGKTSSAGCLASMTTMDVTRQPVSGAGDYFVFVGEVQGSKNGLIFGGFGGPDAIPFLGGTLCVTPPLKRGPIQNSGLADPSGCGGGYGLCINDGIVQPIGLDAGPGNSAWYQAWYRDQAGSFGAAFSNAVQLDFE